MGRELSEALDLGPGNKEGLSCWSWRVGDDLQPSWRKFCQ